MVLTDMPFQHEQFLHNRYKTIQRPESVLEDKTEFSADDTKGRKDYAAFLICQERIVGPHGFLDSSRYSHSCLLKHDTEPEHHSIMKSRVVISAAPCPSVVRLTSNIEQDEKDFQKSLNILEHHMWQHRQEERELKRIEGDIAKSRRAVRHTLRDYGHAMNKKRVVEEMKLNRSLEHLTEIQRQHVHKQHELLDKRKRENATSVKQYKSTDRLAEVEKNKLARQYRDRLSDLEQKRVELLRLNLNFVSKIRLKEEEQHRLKNELTELAITFNTVTQKGRTHRFERLKSQHKDATQQILDDIKDESSLSSRMRRSDGELNAAENAKRKLSTDFTLTKAHLDMKSRDERRHLTDTQIRLKDNFDKQRKLKEMTCCVCADLQARQLTEKLEVNNAKRLDQQTNRMLRKENERGQQATKEVVIKTKSIEEERGKQEDFVKLFTKMVSKDEKKERLLYSTVRGSEYERQQKKRAVSELERRLLAARAVNHRHLIQQQSRCSKAEQQLGQKLSREQAELSKIHARREESYVKLQHHRCQTKEIRHQLREHEREHDRLLSICARANSGDLYT